MGIKFCSQEDFPRNKFQDFTSADLSIYTYYPKSLKRKRKKKHQTQTILWGGCKKCSFSTEGPFVTVLQGGPSFLPFLSLQKLYSLSELPEII